MCVIAVSPNAKARPTLEELTQMYQANPHGIGMSWVERSSKKVLFEKGITVAQAHSWSQEIDGPIIYHFRIASVGKVDDRLCHPFPISAQSPLGLHGKTKTGVLFHNGTWYEWENALLEATIRHKVDMPAGIWSDTRAAAVVIALDGVKAISRMTGKFAVMTPKGYQLWGNWTKVNGFFVSNSYWVQRKRGWTLADQLRAQDAEAGGDDCDVPEEAYEN